MGYYSQSVAAFRDSLCLYFQANQDPEAYRRTLLASLNQYGVLDGVWRHGREQAQMHARMMYCDAAAAKTLDRSDPRNLAFTYLKPTLCCNKVKLSPWKGSMILLRMLPDEAP